MCREAIIRFILLLLGGQPSKKIVMHHEMMVPILSFHGMISSFPDFITFVRVHQKYGVTHNNPKSVIRKNFLSFLMTAIRKLALYKLDL